MGQQIFKHSFFILCFVQDFDACFDSVMAEEQGETDLSETIMYKLMTVCGTFLKANEGKPKQVCWVEQTRSVELTAEQKEEILQVVDPQQVIDVGDTSNMMAIGI